MDLFPTIFLFRLVCLTSGRIGRKIPLTTAYQSSIYHEKYKYFGPEKAIDGNTSQNFSDGSCSHTKAERYTAWWQVYLGQRYEIDRIVIYYRQDKAERLKHFEIYISNKSLFYGEYYNAQRHNLCYEDRSVQNPSVIQNVSCATNMNGMYVTIFNNRSSPEAFLELCEVEVYGCQVTLYGSQCEHNCDPNCLHHECNMNTGKCNQCNTGKFGFNCENRCPEKCYGRICDQDYGKCRECLNGFYGSECQDECEHNCLNHICNLETGKCKRCNPGKFGAYCRHQCPVNCYGNSCDQDSGKCAHCKIGFFGPNCEIQCATGCKGHCHKENGSCNMCQQGYYGNTCSQICITCKNSDCRQENGHCLQGCTETYFGVKCQEMCSNLCLRSICDSKTGQCLECNNGFFGRNCKYQCSSGCFNKCNIDTGKCDECKPGFYGNNCNQTCNFCKSKQCHQQDGRCSLGCTETYFGANCRKRCSSSCLGSICNSQTGHCSDCHPGFYGNNCKEECPKGCMNVNCSRNGNCFEDCVKGYYGSACNGLCSDNCSLEGCDKFSAFCYECKIGLYGAFCQEQCPSKCISKTCNKTTGTCASCIKGNYGLYCNETCSNNCMRESCFQTTGQCSFGCKDGYSGQSCQEQCRDYSYGKNCMYTCGHCLNNNTCHFINGSCLNGCEDNWMGEKCNEEMLELVADTNPVPMIAGISLAISTIIIIIVVGLGVFLYKRKKSRTSTDRSMIVDTQKNKTGEDSNLRVPKNLNRTRHKESIDAEKTLVNIHDNTINIGKHAVKFSFGGEATNAKGATRNAENAEVVYSNIEISCIDVVNLEKEVKKKKSENTFDLEYNKLPRDAVFPCTIATLPENKLLNRFLTTFPYDHSRVVLTDACGSDYINASYIDGVTDGKSYIATQGPKKNTVRDFWRMVWQVKSGKIIMLTNLVENIKSKCDQYWPDLSQSTKAGRLTIRLIHEKEFAFYVSRTFEVMDKQTTECRTVEQLHFTSWPDHGVPDQTELVIFHRRFLLKDNIQPGPPIVHCSAGIGRTGTFIALNALYLHGLTTGKIDVFNYVMSMRNNRMNMIQTKEQYVLLHDALVEQFKYDKTAISTHLFINFWNREKNISLGKRKTKEEFKMLQCEKPKYCQDEFQSGHKKENKNRNRTENILPVEKYRIYLMSVDSSHTNYINAVMLQSVAKRFGYIATHYPLRSTVCDFWCMIFDQESEVIVALNGQSIDGTPWYPTPNDVLNCGRFVIKQTSQPTIFNDVQDTHLKLTNMEANEERDVTLFELMCWPSNTTVPTCKSNILYLLKLVEQLKSDGPITVVCQDGASCCGVFCALSNILQSQTLYEEVNIFTTISQLQRRRPEFINSYEQYQFCHEIVEESLESASIYYNV